MKKQNSNQKSGTIQPLGDRVLIKPISADEKKTASGIIIPDTIDKEKPEQGIVIAVGEGKYDDGKLIPVSVKKGQKVVFSKYGYDEIKIDGEEYYILEEKNILAIVKG
ncbi:MAG: co-chaperone GroES [Patescibacteria group bacterium]